VRNPLRSEAEAFRFLIAVIIAALVIVGAAYLNTWLGVAAAVVTVAGIVWSLRQEPIPGASDSPPKLESATPRGTHCVLVLALPGTATVRAPDRATDIVVVVPALASTVEALTGAVDDRRAAAEETANRLAAQLPNARAEIGADDPALAVEDALRTFGADEIVVVGDEALVATIRDRVTLPVSRA
jgi:hypothetical protein